MSFEQIEKSLSGLESKLARLDALEKEVKHHDACITEMAQKQTGYRAGMVDGVMRAETFGETVVKAVQQDADILQKAGKLTLEVATSPITSADASTIGSGGITVLAGPVPSILNGLPTRGISGVNSLVYSRFMGTEGAADVQPNEGDIKARAKPSFLEVTQNAITIAGITKASKQVLADSMAMQQCIDITLRRSIAKTMDAVLAGGNKVGSATWDGYLALAKPVTGTYTALVDSVSETVTKMLEEGLAPGVIFMAPSTWLALVIAKDKNDRYLQDEYLGALPMELRGTPVVLSPSIPAGKALVVDAPNLEVLVNDSTVVELGYSGEDFERNLISVRAETRFLPTYRIDGAARLVTPKV